MAQPDSCPDLSNGAIVHSPVIICSELEAERGREDDEGGEEDEEVELAEEVGEDVLMMVGVEEGQAQGDDRELNEAEEVRIIQLASLTNGVTSEESVGGERLKENGDEGLVVEHKGYEMTAQQESEQDLKESITIEVSHETEAVPENHLSPTAVEKDEEQYLGNSEEIKADEDNNQDVLLGLETEDNSEDRDDGLEEHQVSSTDTDQVLDSDNLEQESEEWAQLSADDKTENLLIDGEITERAEDPTLSAFQDTVEEDQYLNQDREREASPDSDNAILTDIAGTVEEMTDQTDHQPNMSEGEIENADENDNSESSKREAEAVNRDSPGPRNDCAEAKVEDEGVDEFPEDAASAPHEVEEMGVEADQKVDQPEVASLIDEEQSQTGEGIEEAKMEEVNQEVEEEEVQQVWENTATVADERGQNTEEDGEVGEDNVGESACEEEHEERDDQEVPEGETVPTGNKVQTGFPEPDLRRVDDVPLETSENEREEDVELNHAEEAFEIEEEGPSEPDKQEVAVKSEENEPPAQGADDLQEHPLRAFQEAVKDLEGTLREPQRGQALAEEWMGGGAAKDALLEEMGMVEEPVTVLDDEFDEIEETPTTELDDNEPDSVMTPCDDTAEAVVVEHQELQIKNTEDDGEHDEVREDEKGDAGDDVKPKEDDRELLLDMAERVKGLKEALENGILGAEPQPLNKEECRPTRVLSSKRKDDDWIKKDQPEEEKKTEVKEWRKELKPVKKDLWESEKARKEAAPDERSPPRKDDWIKELKSVIKDESLPKKRDEQVKKKRVVLFEDGRSYFPQREETGEKGEEVKLISHKKVEGPPVSPVPPAQSDGTQAPKDQEYEISLYVKVTTE